MKILKGQAYIAGGKTLVQDQTLILDNGNVSHNTISLVDDIWDDLYSEGTYQSNSKKTYFFWTYKMSDSEDSNVEVSVKLECPRPNDLERLKSASGDWAAYWRGKTEEVYARKDAQNITSQTIVLPGTEYVKPDGEIEKIERKEIEKDPGFGDLTNLLWSF